MHSTATCPAFFKKKQGNFLMWYCTTAFGLSSHATLPFSGKLLKKWRKALYQNSNWEAFTCPFVCIHKCNPSPCSSLEREVCVQHSCFLLDASSVSTNTTCGMLEGTSKSKVLAWTCVFELQYLECIRRNLDNKLENKGLNHQVIYNKNC